MKLKFISLLALLTTVACSGSQNTFQPAQQVTTNTDSLLSYQKVITNSFLRNHLTSFAADSMEGRETGTEGLKKAATYLAKQYEELALEPVGDNNSYFQHFDLTAQRTDSIVFETYKTENGTKNNISKSVNSRESTAPYLRRFAGNNTVDGEILFAGYGLQNEETGINNFKGTDVKGKWILVFDLSNVPQVVQGDTLYTNQRQLARSWFSNLTQKGVAGILLVSENMQQFKESAKANRGNYGQPSGMQLAYRKQEGDGGPSFSYNTVSPAQAAKILDVNGTEGLQEVKKNLTQNIREFTPKATGFGLTQTPYITDVTLETKNVVAFMEGADPKLNDQVVVLSAHYDHVGVGAPDSTGDSIYNGANDDGSGTIGVLSAARAFSRAAENGVKPRRSVLFLSVAGEEKGLLGSRYYSDHPIFPMEKTVADINTDMIGRVDPEHRKQGVTDYIYIIGGDIISSQLSTLVKEGNNRSGQLELDMRYNDLTDPNQFYRRSDHWNFGRFGVPFVFFFNGVHEDYHQPSDEVDKINFDLYAKTARSMYSSTVMVANADSAPQVDNQEFIEITKEN